MERKFYKTTITIELFSDSPVEEIDTLEELPDIMDGTIISWDRNNETLSSKEAAVTLKGNGFDISYFRLNEDGSYAYEVGDAVCVVGPNKDEWQEWQGSIVGFKKNLICVEDQEGDTYDIEEVFVTPLLD